MNKRRLVTTVGAMIVVILSGCATTSPPPATVAKESPRIGVMAIGGEQATHIHIGLTAFNNSEAERASSWPVTDMLSAIVRDSFDGRGSATVHRISNKTLLAPGTSLSRMGWSGPKLRDDIKATIRQAATEQQLDDIVAVVPWRGQVDSDVGVGAEGFGLLTRCGLGVCRDYVFSNYIITVIDTSALEITGYSENQWPVETSRIDFKNRDVKTLNSKDVDLVQPDFQKGLESRVVEALKRAGLG